MNSSAGKPTITPTQLWYYAGGAITLLAGFFAMARPGLASVAITQIVGIICLVSGAALLISALFGKARKHRLLDFFSAALRLVVGLMLIIKVVQGIMALTLVLSAIFIAEGIFGIILAFGLRGKNPAWVWVLLNAIIALVLGGMLLAKFPSDSDWAIGLLFGINAVFVGVSMIMFSASMPKAQES